MSATALLSRLSRTISAPGTPKQEAPKFDGMTVQSHGKYAKMSVAEAAVAFLKESRRSQRTIDIANELSSNGYEFSGNNPGAALTRALLRRSTSDRDLLKVGYGSWCLREFLSSKENAAFEHKARTSRGMRDAAKRGTKIGAKAKLTEAVAVKLKEQIAACASARKASESVGISCTTFTKWKERIDAWTPGQPWPPEGPSPWHEDQAAPRLRAVK